MARVLIDCHMFSEAWFSPILGELVSSDHVKFVYSECQKFSQEASKVRKALSFYKLMGSTKDRSNTPRRIDVDKASVEMRIEYLNRQPIFCDCSHCDDPHVFAIIYEKPTKYVFSNDTRMAKCRDTINTKLDKRYCDFIVVSSVPIYQMHSANIKS